MPLESILAFAIFAFVASITPGPNNLMLLASGMNFGFRASIPHMLGIGTGFFVLILAVGLGLGEAFAQYPWIYRIMKWVGIAYLLYLTWRILTCAPISQADSNAKQVKPLRFWEAALFQWVNPKGWAMAISAFSTYTPASASGRLVMALSGLFALICLPCIMSWTFFGTSFQMWLKHPRHATWFNRIMGLLLLASLVAI